MTDLSAASAAPWRSHCDILKECGQLVESLQNPADAQDCADLFNMFASSFAASYLAGVQADPSYTDFMPISNTSLPVSAPCPDFNYFYAPIDAAGIYRISGYRGTSRFVVMQAGYGWSGLGGNGKILHSFSLDDFGVWPEGEVNLVISAVRPEKLTVPWWRIPEGSDHLFVRHCISNWEHETDARLSIERLDVPAARPRLSAAEINRRLGIVFSANRRQTPKWLGIIAAEFERGMVNRAGYLPIAQGGNGVSRQLYYSGAFDVKPDEALILEAVAPKDALYWSVGLTDLAFQHIDFMHRCASLNGDQAFINADGRVRMVFAHRDTGFANWLDISGYQRGMFIGRLNNCDVTDLPDFKLVPYENLRKHLPNDTPVVTLNERDAWLRRRRRALQLRRRW